MRSVRGKLCAAFSFGPGSARDSHVSGRAVSIADFSGVQIHFAALLTTFGRGRRNCAREPPALPGKRVATVSDPINPLCSEYGNRFRRKTSRLLVGFGLSKEIRMNLIDADF
ncbi:MAG: hypothetical protein DMF32_04330 [Verrucomicrobia bacterium]|nr:MAG: hypothetical protein DMF32_04330 [Verrucomicrobiota bacterium]